MTQLPREYRKILSPLSRFARRNKAQVYLVGGILRDLFLKRQGPNPDFDFAVKKGAINFGRKFSRRLKCGFVLLDKRRGACRLVKKTAKGFYTLDFTDFRGKTLAADLASRDFTVNALALPLDAALSAKDIRPLLIGDCRGQEDLGRKIIRAAGKDSFRDDPLRVLRAFGFAAELGFEIEGDTLRLAQAARQGLAGVSAERVRDELFRLLGAPLSYPQIVRLDERKILEVIFPEIKPMRGIGQGPYHHLDVWGHTLETLAQLEGLLRELPAKQELRAYLDLPLAGERQRQQLLKLAALLHDTGKPATLRRGNGKVTFHGHERVGEGIAKGACRRLKLSGAEEACLRRIIRCHLRPGFLSDLKLITARAKFRFFRDAGEEAAAVLLLSVADQRATKGPIATPASRLRQEKVAFMLLREYFHKQAQEKPARLLDGNDVMRALRIPPSPLVGKILAALEEAQAIGRVKTRSSALALIVNLRGCNLRGCRGKGENG
jgi:tRNA nucleotidyltransferase/poly(A) polymerase